MTTAALRRLLPATLLRVALCAIALMPATGAAEIAGQGFLGVRLGMDKAEVMALGLGLIELDPDGPDGQEFHHFESGDPGQSFHVTLQGADARVVYMELDQIEGAPPSALPLLDGTDATGFAFGQTALWEIERHHDGPGYYFACRPFDIIDGGYLITTAYPEDDGTLRVYFTRIDPDLVTAGAIDPAFGLIAQSVLTGVAITRTDYTAANWCRELNWAHNRPELPQFLVDRLEWSAVLAELPDGDPRLAWVAEKSRWRYDPTFDLVGKHGNVVFGDQMTLSLNADCTAADIALFLAIPGSVGALPAEGDTLSAEFGVLAESGFYPETDSLKVIGARPHTPEGDGPPLSFLLVTPGALPLDWLLLLPQMNDVWAYQIRQTGPTLFQADTNAWDTLGLFEALNEAIDACMAR
jgi:hypothetical protein